ncbi:MAG: TrmH family RNA methyltransferase [Parvularculaceae bacterium]
MTSPKSPTAREGSPLWIYGRHAGAAALANPARRVRRGLATKNARDWYARRGATPAQLDMLADARPDAIDRELPAGAVHQGFAVLVDDLPRARLKDVCAPAEPARPVVVLDQIPAPQNIGAIFRAAAAFGARAVVAQDRRTPALAGALAKAAAGAIETTPCARVVNVSRALEALRDLGYYCVGLAGEAPAPIGAAPADRPIALALGAEGAGLRELVAATCDAGYRIPIAAEMESLNVAAAAAVALYEITARRA